MQEARKPLLLIADDEPANVHVLVETLRHDYRIKVATNGKMALDLANREDQPDLVILDVMMPGMDGFQVCRRLKAQPETHDIPVIFVTALNTASTEYEGLQLEAVDYISKPVNPAILRMRVRNLVKLKLLQDRLLEMSTLDGLTGIANRRRFGEFLDIQWRSALRAGTPMALIMTDVDLFKQFNDHYGHIAGDECLQQVAATLAAGLRRPGDLTARYGGEEFACILGLTDAEGAGRMAEALRAAIEQLRIPHAGSPYGVVTISCGVETMVPAGKALPFDLVERADKKLYAAKITGRNRVIF